MFKMMKVFEYWDMPKDLQQEFFKTYDHLGQNSCMSWTINDTVNPDQITQEVDKWLITNGAKGAPAPEHEGECVLIRVRW